MALGRFPARGVHYLLSLKCDPVGPGGLPAGPVDQVDMGRLSWGTVNLSCQPPTWGGLEQPNMTGYGQFFTGAKARLVA